MNFVKWMRKNNTKIMAVVVIVLMIGFIGGSSLKFLLGGSGRMKDTVAYYGAKHKITNYDLAIAGQQLEVLQALQADRVLQAQDLRGIMLSELLFSHSRASAAVMNYAMQMIRRNQLPISDKQLRAMYERTVPPNFYWLLLRDEADSAGIRVPPGDVAGLLGRIMPQLFNGQSYPAVMGSLVNRFGMSEERILTIFGNLLAVLQYAQTICSTESITVPQLRHMASRQGETLDVAFVQLEAYAFADKHNEPADDALRSHFDKYKGYLPGDVSEDNPFGFGYKQPSRLQLEYIAVDLGDVASIVKPPTEEEAMAFYRQNRERLYTEQVPSNPQDPDSDKVPRVTSYAEVADAIHEQLRQERIATRAEQVLLEARNVADANIVTVMDGDKKPTVEQLKAEAGDYQQTAQRLAERYKIPLHQGQTGWLSARDMQTDPHLGRLFVSGHGANPVRLSQVLFSVEALGEEATLVLFGSAPRMYTTIGPASDSSGAGSDLAGRIMLIARVIGVREAGPPEGLDVTLSTKTLDLDGAPEEADDHTYSVRKDVVDDLRKLTAWDTTTEKAKEFEALARKEGWDPAIAKFNELYGKQAKDDPNDPNAFKLDQLVGLQGISDAQLQALAAQMAGNPTSQMILNEARVEQQFINRLYALVPAGEEAPPTMPQIMEFKPNQAVYMLKELSVRRLTQPQYEQTKGMLLQQADYALAQSLAVVHFNPSNILKRMNFRLVERKQTTDANQPQQQSEEPA